MKHPLEKPTIIACNNFFEKNSKLFGGNEKDFVILQRNWVVGPIAHSDKSNQLQKNDTSNATSGN